MPGNILAVLFKSIVNTKKENRKDRYKAKEIFKKVFKNMNLGTIFRVHPAFSMIKAFEKGLLMTENCPEYWD